MILFSYWWLNLRVVLIKNGESRLFFLEENVIVKISTGLFDYPLLFLFILFFDRLPKSSEVKRSIKTTQSGTLSHKYYEMGISPVAKMDKMTYKSSRTRQLCGLFVTSLNGKDRISAQAKNARRDFNVFFFWNAVDWK